MIGSVSASTAPSSSDARSFGRRQPVVVAAIFAVVLAALIVGYMVLLRVDYVALYSELRPGDAAAVKAELDKRGVPYRLSDGGRTILVPAPQADGLRLDLSGSEAAQRGQVGFELFNKSDMGLTSFAQKINYQRALQGELVRTIMMMDGIDGARVHLAIPEKSLFRGEQHDATAAVTIALKPGATADEARVAGIQRLVSSAVPDLPAMRVTVLDEAGRVISPDPALDRPAAEDMGERGAIQSYYAARTRDAIGKARPGLDVAVSALVLDEFADGGATAQPATEDMAPGSRNYRLRVTLVTGSRLNDDDRRTLANAVGGAIALDVRKGDELVFQVGPTTHPVPVRNSYPAGSAIATRGFSADNAAPAPDSGSAIGLWWVILALGAGAAVAVAFARGRRAILDEREHATFAEQLSRQLHLSDGVDAAR